MSDYFVIFLVLALFEALGIFAVVNAAALLDYLVPQVKPHKYPETKPYVKFIGWGFIIFPILISTGFYFGRNP